MQTVPRTVARSMYIAVVATLVGITTTVAMCIRRKKSHIHMEIDASTSVIGMHSNPLRHKGVGGAGGAAGSEGEVVMPRPRVRDDYDGRPIEERLGDLAESLNKEWGTSEDQPSARRLSVAKWSWPTSGRPMWIAPPPPTEPITALETPAWSTKKASTEKRLFGGPDGDPGDLTRHSSLAVTNQSDGDYIDVRGDFDDSEIATPTKTVPSKRGSVYGFEAEVEVEVAAGATHAKPRLNLPPPPPPPVESGVRKGSGQWEEMDFSAKRSKLGASINLSTMLPGARPAVGLRKSVYVDDGDGGDNTTPVKKEAGAGEAEITENNDSEVPLSNRLNDMLARGPHPEKTPAETSTAATPVTAGMSDDVDGSDTYGGFGDDDDMDLASPPLSPTPSANSLSEFDEVGRGDTLRRVRRPTGPQGRRKPSTRLTPSRDTRPMSDVSIGDLHERESEAV
eukprot:m.361222 g.361222  ORF g.361222 m.361222 type:complete len:451 (+) comp28049_c0_seq6:2-1354(+)